MIRHEGEQDHLVETYEAQDWSYLASTTDLHERTRITWNNKCLSMIFKGLVGKHCGSGVAHKHRRAVTHLAFLYVSVPASEMPRRCKESAREFGARKTMHAAMTCLHIHELEHTIPRSPFDELQFVRRVVITTSTELSEIPPFYAQNTEWWRAYRID